MGARGKLLVVWTVVITVLFALVSPSLALPPRQAAVDCYCECVYQGQVAHKLEFASDSATCGKGTGCAIEVSPNNFVTGTIENCIGAGPMGPANQMSRGGTTGTITGQPPATQGGVKPPLAPAIRTSPLPVAPAR
jgi:hypothetical protein